MANMLPSLRPLPGMAALGAYRPDTTAHISAMADILLRDGHPDSTLLRSDRETIAAYVSSRNDCSFCATSHGAVAEAHARREGVNVVAVEAVCERGEIGDVSAKLKVLLQLAEKVRQYEPIGEEIAKAKEEGVSDMDVHDAVLIASHFSMVNRYVDSLTGRVEMPKQAWAGRAEGLAGNGYVRMMSQSR